jgi:hypothetical protein
MPKIVKRQLDLEPLKTLAKNLVADGEGQEQGQELDHDHEIQRKRLRLRLRTQLGALDSLVAGLRRELDELQLRSDLELLNRIVRVTLPLWPVSMFGLKTVYGLVTVNESRVDVKPTVRVPQDMHLLFGDLGRPHHEARSEKEYSFDLSGPRDQWPDKAKELPISGWAEFARQGHRVVKWVQESDFWHVEVPTLVQHDKELGPGEPMRLARISPDEFMCTSAGLVVGDWRGVASFSAIHDALLAWLSERRALLDSVLVEFPSALLDLVEAYLAGLK